MITKISKDSRTLSGPSDTHDLQQHYGVSRKDCERLTVLHFGVSVKGFYSTNIMSFVSGYK